MTVEELEIIIRANIEDAMSGIKKITNEVKQAVSNSIEPMKNLTNQAKSTASSSASSVSQMKQQLKSYNTSINETAKQQDYLKSKIESLKYLLNKADMGFEVGDTLKIEADIEKLENSLKKLQSQGQATGKQTESAFDKVKNKVKLASSQMAGLGSKFKTVLAGSKNLGKGFTTAFDSGIKSIKKFALSLLSVRTTFSMISKAIQSYLSYDTQLSNSIQNCWNVLGSLLAPILEYVVSLFSKAVSYINAFVQALTGINLVARANAKAINSQTAATKDLDNTQSSLDEFHTVSTDNSSGSGSSNNTITVEDVDLKRLKDKLLNADWYSVGMEIGKKINQALANVNWDFIQKMSIALATNLANLLNGLVDGIDWTLIGSTIGNGVNTALLFVYTFITSFDWQKFGTAVATGINNIINTVDWTLLGQTLASNFVALIDFAYSFVTTFDWSKFGISIGEAIMGFFNEIDWAKAGETLSTGIRGLFTSIKELIANIDWQQLGNDVWTFISNIDWSGMISDLAYILGEAIAGIGQFIWGFIEDGVKSIGEYFSEKIEECGGDIIAGLFKGILDAIDGIYQWINENLFTPFIDGFKKMFGINSPSTVMAELGTYLIDGLKNGISGIWTKVKEEFTNLKIKITDTFTDTLEKIKDVFSINTLKNYFEQVSSGIKDVFASIPDWFKDKFTTAWTNVKNVFSSGGQIFSDIKDGITATFKKIANSLIAGINKVIAVPFNAINTALKKLKTTSIAGFKPFSFISTISVPQIPSLASGGVLDSETIIRVAEYSNAKSNPEIVSPRDMMKETFKEAIEESGIKNNQTQKVDVEVHGKTEVDGDKLVVVYDKAKNNRGYNGSKNTVFLY